MATRHDEATRKAKVKYNKEKTKQIGLRFYPSDFDVFDFAKSKDNVQGYIKSLIRADMERNGEEA